MPPSSLRSLSKTLPNWQKEKRVQKKEVKAGTQTDRQTDSVAKQGRQRKQIARLTAASRL